MNRFSLFLVIAFLSMAALVTVALSEARPSGSARMPSPPLKNGKDMPAPPPDGGARKAELKGAYTLSSDTASTDNGLFISDKQDTSAVWVKRKGYLHLYNPEVKTTGSTSSNEGSSFFGLNAAILASEGGKINIQKGSVLSSGSGANGLFATDKGSVIVAKGVAISATGEGAHGIMASNGGVVTLERSSIYTRDAHAAAIATDRGGGIITASNSKLVTKGEGSPALYSTGALTGTNLYGDAENSEAIVIEGKNSVVLEDSAMIGRKNGAMIYQSFSGDAQGIGGLLSMTGGIFTAVTGALIYVTNSSAEVILNKVALQTASGILAQARADRWGRPGENGGHLDLKVAQVDMAGDLIADGVSSIAASLKQKTTLKGKVVNASLSIDPSSQWIVTGPSFLNGLAPAGKETLRRIKSNGFCITYDEALDSNQWLGGKQYALQGGGVLMPK